MFSCIIVLFYIFSKHVQLRYTMTNSKLLISFTINGILPDATKLPVYRKDKKPIVHLLPGYLISGQNILQVLQIWLQENVCISDRTLGIWH